MRAWGFWPCQGLVDAWSQVWLVIYSTCWWQLSLILYSAKWKCNPDLFRQKEKERQKKYNILLAILKAKGRESQNEKLSKFQDWNFAGWWCKQPRVETGTSFQIISQRVSRAMWVLPSCKKIISHETWNTWPPCYPSTPQLKIIISCLSLFLNDFNWWAVKKLLVWLVSLVYPVLRTEVHAVVN